MEGRDGDKGVTVAAGRLRSSSLRQTLVDKTVSWLRRHGAASWRDVPATESDVSRQLDGPGIVVFAHRHRRCFRLVARAHRVFSWCSDALRDAFEGSNPDPLSALLITSLSQDWDFYFVPVLATGRFYYIYPIIFAEIRNALKSLVRTKTCTLPPNSPFSHFIFFKEFRQMLTDFNN